MAPLSPLASPSATRAVLEAHGLATKYSFGQNFLVNDAIVQKIITLAQVGPEDVVLEVGPGIGTLTIALLKGARSVTAVERDPDLPAVLAETCAPWAEKFALLSKDALDLEPADFGGPAGSSPSVLGPPTKLVANLPYAVAATVVLDYFERFSSLESATVMVQKEVADRIAASPGSKNYGAYTVKLRLYAQVEGRFGVGAGNFFPPPRVESAVVRLDRHPVRDEAGNPLDAVALRAAATMADAAFANRRKTLANSCKMYFLGRGEEGAHIVAQLPRLFEAAAIDPRLRGETLEVADFVCLGKALCALLA